MVYELPRKGVCVSISHLLFADDSVIFCQASVQEVQGVLEVLDYYTDGSEQFINREKGSLFFWS